MFRIALIILALVLASCVSASAPNAATVTNADTLHPVTISCDIPGPKPRTILVPAGKLPSDVCPGSAIYAHFGPGMVYSAPAFSGLPPPCVSCVHAAGGSH